MYFPKAVLVLLALSVSQAACAPVAATSKDVTVVTHHEADHLVRREPEPEPRRGGLVHTVVSAGKRLYHSETARAMVGNMVSQAGSAYAQRHGGGGGYDGYYCCLHRSCHTHFSTASNFAPSPRPMKFIGRHANYSVKMGLYGAILTWRYCPEKATFCTPHFRDMCKRILGRFKSA